MATFINSERNVIEKHIRGVGRFMKDLVTLKQKQTT